MSSCRAPLRTKRKRGRVGVAEAHVPVAKPEETPKRDQIAAGVPVGEDVGGNSRVKSSKRLKKKKQS